MTYRSRLVLPPEEQEINPYAPVWLPLALQLGIFAAVVFAVYVVFDLFALNISPLGRRLVDIGLVVLPVALWVMFSLLRERRAQRPRARLFIVFVISALVASAIAIPLIDDVFQLERWLSLNSALNRIIGYTITIGITQEALKYLVVRYIAWDDYFRTRLDSVAFALASALGYSFVLNLQFALQVGARPQVVAAQAFDNVALNIAAGLIVAFGLSEVRFGRPSPILMTLTLAFAALLNGVVIPLRAGFINAGFSIEQPVNAPSLIFGIVLTAAVTVGVALLISFFFTNAERRAREAAREDDDR